MESARFELKIVRKHFVATLLIVLIVLTLECVLLRELSVYNTGIGAFLLVRNLLIHGVLLAFLSLLLITIASYFRRNLVWGISYIATALACLASFSPAMNESLGLDVTYIWVLNKSGFDWLKLQYLNGWSIAFIFILVALLFASDFRISRERGKDGKKHFYIHSKLLGLIRLATAEEKIGDNPDNPIVGKKAEEKREVSEEWWGRKIRGYKDAHWNDKVRLFSVSYGIWAGIKILLGFVIASRLANSFALRYLMIQNYLEKTGMTWFQLLQKYLGITLMRISGTVAVPQDFPINEAFTFEIFQFFQPLVFYFCLLWIVRLIMALIGEGYTYTILVEGSIKSIRNILSNIFVICTLVTLPFLIAIPTWVFNMATPYSAWQLMILFIVFLSLSLISRFVIKSPTFREEMERWTGWLGGGPLSRKMLKVFGLLALIPLIIAPLLVSWATVQPYIQGRQYEYVWTPAYLPTIYFTRWAYEIDEVERADSALIATSDTEALKEIRIFTLEAAKLNMKPHVGVNWMSIDPSDVDIVHINDTEYWVTVLTLVRPPYPSDVDVWRADHLLLTHSEKILAIDASTTKMTDVKGVFNLNQTPQIYYGEGGLWKEVDEVYLNIPGFSETHLPDYQGSLSYDEDPDYVYRGFWRAWKFYGMWRWDFAQGDYGDISALVNRDVNERVSKILLPGLIKESDAYPVIDEKGNLYLLYWVWIIHDSPHGFCDYPEHTQNQISRLFAVVLVNLKNGKIEGYLMNREREDYLLSFYHSFYKQWDKAIPIWLENQLRYPEEFLERQIDVYNWYFQNDFQKWQRNEFYELTLGEDGKPIEDVRYIVMPIDGKLTWCAVRLVEWYKGTTRNLAGMYVAPSGEETGKVYFVDFKGKTIIGPSIALSTVRSNPELTKHPYFPQWKSGNILMYSLGQQFYYIIPYYKEEAAMLLPQMVAIVNAQDQSMGFYILRNPKDPIEVSMATTYALEQIGVKVAKEIEINGTLIEKYEYVENGNTRWLLNIQLENGTVVEVLAKAEALNIEEISKIIHLKIGDDITVRVDENKFVIKVLHP